MSVAAVCLVVRTIETVSVFCDAGKDLFECVADLWITLSKLGLEMTENRMYVRNIASHPVLPAEHRMPKLSHRSNPANQEGIVMNSSLSSTSTSPAPTSAPVVRLRLTRRGRTVLTTLAATPLVLAALSFALNGGTAIATMTEGSQASMSVTVSAGQSLWQLAEQLAPNDDTREVVAQLLRANSLESAEVYPGQQLVIPDQYRPIG